MQSTGALAEIERVELLFTAAQLASTLRMDLHILPISASLLAGGQAAGSSGGGGSGSSLDRQPAAAEPKGVQVAASRMPVLDINEFGVSTTFQLLG